MESPGDLKGLKRPVGFVIRKWYCAEVQESQADRNGKRQCVEGMFKGGFKFLHGGLF